ncbi:MAG: hypothetical protein MUE40_05285 [Anaerolineae bacterium]|jgi:hypothetical protein|nr:hypothetical protein [Anaerolineae bacterium]
MRKYSVLFTIGAMMLAAAFMLLMQPAALAQEDEPSEPPFLASFYNAWVASPHADAEAEAFVHWNDEGEIPVDCAKCHSTPGYLDFLGEDGSEFGVVDAPAPLGSVVTCDACHNSTASNMTNVVFPSGAEISDAGGSSRCMQCHQGRASTVSVNTALEEAGLLEDLDTVNAELGFINIHYYAAAASLYGTEARGGYQYDGKRYELKNDHVEGFNTCSDCHNPHSLEIDLVACAECHEDVESVEDLRFIRMQGSEVDYDGDGDLEEGISQEIETLQAMLYEAIQAYARDVAGTPIVYDDLAYPYFFIDTNDNGEVDEGEAAFPNKYNAFTGNLLKAAYNFQVSKKDPGGYVHNAQYHIHLLYDSIEALNGALTEQVDLTFANRNATGHFDTTAQAFRHWDEDGEVPGTCAKCHTSSGLPTFLKNNTNIAVEPSNSLACTSCHDDLVEFTVYTVNEVTFPSGQKVSFGEGDVNNLCLNCHQGRESTTSVNRAIAGAAVGDDEVSSALSFRNIHYFAAGASLFGTQAKGAYEFEGKEYNGRYQHGEDAPSDCTSCHYKHELSIQLDECAECHEDVETRADLRLIRADAEGEEAVDADGDGDVAEPIADEIDTLEADLLVKIYAYATDTIGTSIVYEPSAHPYWFIDLNGNGAADPDEINRDNRYATWTPNLLRAAFNFQYVAKDPGGYAHNPDYVLQVLYDSLEAIGGAEAVATYNRPPVEVVADS